nr:hypothetical protein [Bifidobacterium indicum]
MKDNMNKNGNNESASDQKTRKKGILTRVREITCALATYFATSHGVWGYVVPVTIPACIAGLLAARLLGVAPVFWLLLPMFAVIMAETLVETRRSREEWGAAGLRTVVVSTGFLVLARLLFLDQPAVYLLIMYAAYALIGASMLIWMVSRFMVILISLIREVFFSVDDDSVDGRMGVVLTFLGPAMWILFPAVCDRFWIALAVAAVSLVVYLLVFLHELREQEYFAWLVDNGYCDVSPDGVVTLRPSGKAVNVNDRQEL